MITILGPTATGKTALAARLAYKLNGEVISADSRQVFRGMTLGTGKDYDDYCVNGTTIPYHLLDIADPGYEYNIYEYQRDFLVAYQDIIQRNKLPILCGGSGMYLEAVLKGYNLVKASESKELIQSLAMKTDQELVEMLKSTTVPHNTTDFESRERLTKAILIAQQKNNPENRFTSPATRTVEKERSCFPKIDGAVFGIHTPREVVMKRIATRLQLRLSNGMIEEVSSLINAGLTPERLMKYGLEYKYVTLFLMGKITEYQLFTELNIAIRQFAKRQMTWFRRMERQGLAITWIDGTLNPDEKLAVILHYLKL